MYRIVRALVKLFYPKTGISGTEHLPQEPCVVVANHCQMNGPIVGELYFPGERAIWCAGEMMHAKEVPAYAYRDFWSRKPKGVRWFYKGLSYLITPLSVCVFNHARTIPVYRDGRLTITFRRTVEALKAGKTVVIFPEHDAPHNQILCDFQEGFVDVAKIYYRQTGKTLSFVPMYLAPALHQAYLGEPVAFQPDAPSKTERRRICEVLMARITKLATDLPRHRVVPYNNVFKGEYGYNIPMEEEDHENTGR